MDSLYRELVIEHYKRPQNFGELEAPDAQSYEYNPLCGDELGAQLRIMNGRISELRFQGQGCAISQAAASLVSVPLQGMKIEEVEALDAAWLQEILGFELTPVRLKCGMMGINAVQAALATRG
jgi:nitrogen fixation NifU-like protein